MRDRFRQMYTEGLIPKGVYRLSTAEAVYDLPNMIKTHLDLLDGDASDRVKRPYRLRLENLLKQLRDD